MSARRIRCRRGLSLEVAGGLAGISGPYLSMLERGQRGFSRRGLIEDLADALSCSVADLTGQPYLPPDRESARAKTVIAQIERGLNEATLDDVPDLLPRPLDALDGWTRHTMELRDTAGYRSSGEGIAAALIELQVHLATSDGLERQRAAELLTQAAYHAFVLATTFGYLHLAQLAAQRAFDAARIAERPELEAFAMFARAPSVARTGGRRRAVGMLHRALDDAQQLTTIRDGETLGAETFGLLHLMVAHFAARDSDAAAAADHLDEAAWVAMLTGERNGLQQHFGPTNVNVWRVAIGAELGQGPAAAERVEREPIDLDTLGSKDFVWPVTLQHLGRGHGRSLDHRPRGGCSALVDAGETHDNRRDRQLYGTDSDVSPIRLLRQGGDTSQPAPGARSQRKRGARARPAIRCTALYEGASGSSTPDSDPEDPARGRRAQRATRRSDGAAHCAPPTAATRCRRCSPARQVCRAGPTPPAAGSGPKPAPPRRLPAVYRGISRHTRMDVVVQRASRTLRMARVATSIIWLRTTVRAFSTSRRAACTPRLASRKRPITWAR